MIKQLRFGMEENDNIDWYGQSLESDKIDLADEGKGNAIILRPFVYKMRPDLKQKPTKDEIITPQYLKYLEAQLWGDGLRMVMEPRVVFEKDKFTVFVAAEPRPGHTLMEKTKLIQEYASSRHSK